MDANSQQPERRDGALSALNAAIEAMNLAKEVSSVTPAKAVFGSVGVLLTMIRVPVLLSLPDLNVLILDTCNQDSVANKADYVELGLTCANVCRALDRGMNGKKLDEISQSVSEAINQLTTWVKPMVHGLDGSLMALSELWRKSKGRFSNRVDGTQSLEFSMQRRIKKRLPLGS